MQPPSYTHTFTSMRSDFACTYSFQCHAPFKANKKPSSFLEDEGLHICLVVVPPPFTPRGLYRFYSYGVNLRTITGAFRSQLLHGSLVSSRVSLGYLTAALTAYVPLSDRHWDSRFVPIMAIYV